MMLFSYIKRHAYSQLLLRAINESGHDEEIYFHFYADDYATYHFTNTHDTS